MPSYLDWFPFYISRWRRSKFIRGLSCEARGAWLELSIEQWEDGDLPPTVSALALMACCSDSVIRQVLSAFPYVPGSRRRRRNPQLHEIREHQHLRYQRRADAGRKGGQSKAERASSNATAKPSNRSDQSDSVDLRDQTNGPSPNDSKSSDLIEGCGRCPHKGKWAGYYARRRKVCDCPLGQFRLHTLGVLRAAAGGDDVTPEAVGQIMAQSGRVARV